MPVSLVTEPDIREIFIPLLDEGTSVYRPTQGVFLKSGETLVLPTDNYDPNIETWQFVPGSIVRCSHETHEGKTILVARELCGQTYDQADGKI